MDGHPVERRRRGRHRDKGQQQAETHADQRSQWSWMHSDAIICVAREFGCRLTRRSRTRRTLEMEIDRLREFAAIAESGSFSKAARRLRIAQPPLSRHIRQLETELGIKLFERSATGVEITREGALLLQQARAVLDDASALFDLATR